MENYITQIRKTDHTTGYLSANTYTSGLTGVACGFVQVSIHGASCGTFDVTPAQLREFAANLLKVAEEVEAINAKIPA